MADRRVKVVFSAEIQNFKASMDAAATATQKAADASKAAGKAADKSAEDIQKQALAHHAAAKAAGLQYDNTGQLVTMNGKALSSQQAAAHGLQTFSQEAYLAGRAAVSAGEDSEAAAKAAAAAEAVAAEAIKARKEAMQQMGAMALTVGTATIAGLGLVGKAAMDWESAWAGVTKTVDGTPAQMDELEASLRGLAKTLPATHEEIAGVAEAAGQLGVKREDVAGFTKTMIDLGETTNLTADEAATGIAQISNVMGTMARDGSKGVERFGATLVALGNAGASTEAEILDMAKRIAGAAKLVGASESDVLALANAMASVGIEAQLGGGVISRVMQRMYGDVKSGGEGLDNLAKVAGVSSKDFATAFETDPVRAVDSLVKGFGRIKDEGGNVIDAMSDLGIKGTEETSVILRLAGAGDILADSLALGDSAWESNSALAEEAAKRYETTESKVKIAWNNIKDAAIEAGAVLLPVIAGIAEGAAGIAKAFGAIPAPIQGVLTVLGGVAGVAALGAGAFLTLTPKILDSVQAFNTLVPAGGKAATALGKVGKAAGVAGALATVTLIFAKLAESDYMSKIDTGMGRVSNALAEVATNGPGASTALDEIFKDRDGGDLINTVTDLDGAIKRTFNRDAGQQFNDWGEAVVNGMTGVKGSSQILEDSFKRLDTGLAELVSGGKAGDAAKSFEQIKKAAADQGVTVEELVKKFPEYADALKAAEGASKTAAAEGKNLDGSLTDAGLAAETAAKQSEEIEKALEEVGVAADGTVTDLVKFTDALINAGLLQLSARDAARGFEEALDAMDESLKTNGATLDTTTEKGRANEAALDAIAGAGYRSAEAMAANGSSQEALAGNLDTTFNKLVSAARAFTDTDEEAQALARDIMQIPPGVDVKTWMSDEAKRMAEQTKGALDAIPKEVRISVVEEYTKFIQDIKRPTIEDLNGDSFRPGNSLKVPGLTGGATGGRVSDIMGFAGGGKVPGRAPSDLRLDNMLGLVNGKPIAVQSEEWIINGRSSKDYDRELAAINAGTFPKMPGYANGGRAREYEAPRYAYQPSSPAQGGGMNVERLEIHQQSDPVATFHEFNRRANMLRT